MAGVYKRTPVKTKEKGSKPTKWTIWWKDENGVQRTKVGFTDKTKSQALADANEARCRMIKDGHVDPAEEARKSAASRAIQDHIDDYRAELVARGDTPKHVEHAISTIQRIVRLADIESIASIPSDRIRVVIAGIKSEQSSRTANHALGCLKAFLSWLEDCDRLKAFPSGIKKIKAYPVKGDRKRIRRAIGMDDIERLIIATESAPTRIAYRDGSHGKAVAWITGPERAMLYRLAIETGFRANELRQLTPECFKLDDDHPTVTCLAKFSKRGKRSGKDDVQPIRRAVAPIFREFLKGRPKGQSILAIPQNTALMIETDLKLIGIPYRDSDGRVLDFHALRGSFITNLVKSGANIKAVQKLARHSTITLTMDVYATIEDDDIRSALEGSGDRGSTPGDNTQPV